MVNLAFCRLDVTLSDHFWQFRSTTFLYFHYIPSAGRSFMLDYPLWSSKGIWVGAGQNARDGSSAVRIWFQERSSFSLILRENQLIFEDHGSWFRYAGCFGTMMDFFKQSRASVQIEADGSLELFGFIWWVRQILFTSVPLYYFDLKSDWLPLNPVAFGSPPEDLLFW